MSKLSRLNAPVDRRLAGKNKSIGNRERFLHRHKDQVREAVKRAIDNRGIRDVGKEKEEVHIPKRDLKEPVFGHGQGGVRDMVHPGNKDFVRGDRIERPKGGGSGGSGKGQASDSGEGEDDFIFTLSKEEFMQIFFDDLALPNMERMQLAETPEFKYQRAGYSTDGTQNNLALVKSLRNKIGRAIAGGLPADKEKFKKLKERLAILESFAPMYEWESEIARNEIKEIREELESLALRIGRVKLDPHDLRYRSRVRVPVPTSKAVMFCLMDISGSMDEERKDLSKRFFVLLYLFLTRYYERIDLVFIRHHTQAQEVSEEDFFHSRETGGTVVSSALILMDEIITERYSPSEWNIYGAQASDGDNWHNDNGRSSEILKEQILPLCRYFAYVQVAEAEQSLWEEYAKLQSGHSNFAMKKALDPTQIYPVFRELFKKEKA
jgi:uncharacterized sporulation protein YeaH/YhbH (DUF444 family)